MPIGAFRLNTLAAAMAAAAPTQALVVASQTSPYILFYNRSGDVFTKVADPSTLPTGANSQSQAKFNLASTGYSAGSSVAITTGTSPYVHIYNRTGDTFTKLANPSTLPTGECHGVTWGVSNSGSTVYLAVAHDTSPYFTAYTRSGDTFTKFTNPATLPTGSGEGIAWSTQGANFLAVGFGGATPGLKVYSRSGTTLTQVANLTPGGTVYSIAWSPDSNVLAVGHDTTPFVTIYNRTTNTFTKVANPATLPTGRGAGIEWNPSGTSLAVSHPISPYLTVYNKSGDTYTKIADPATLPPANGQDVSWNSDGTSLAVMGSASPFIAIYNRSGDTLTKIADPATMPANYARGLDFSLKP